MTGPDVTVGCKFKGGRRTMDVPSPAKGLKPRRETQRFLTGTVAPQPHRHAAARSGSERKKFRFSSLLHELPPQPPPAHGWPRHCADWPEPERCGGPSRGPFKPPRLERESQHELWGKPSSHAPTLLC